MASRGDAGCLNGFVYEPDAIDQACAQSPKPPVSLTAADKQSPTPANGFYPLPAHIVRSISTGVGCANL
jgi:hypothetical protein